MTDNEFEQGIGELATTLDHGRRDELAHELIGHDDDRLISTIITLLKDREKTRDHTQELLNVCSDMDCSDYVDYFSEFLISCEENEIYYCGWVFDAMGDTFPIEEDNRAQVILKKYLNDPTNGIGLRRTIAENVYKYLSSGTESSASTSDSHH